MNSSGRLRKKSKSSRKLKQKPKTRKTRKSNVVSRRKRNPSRRITRRVASNNKRKISKKPRKFTRKVSNSRKTWDKMLRNKDSRRVLQSSWSSKNPQVYYRRKVTELASKYGINKN